MTGEPTMIMHGDLPEINNPEFTDWLAQWHAEHNSPEAQALRAQEMQPEPDTAYLQRTGYCLTARGADYLETPSDDDDGGDLRPVAEVAMATFL
jgi:hypothetical protein